VHLRQDTLTVGRASRALWAPPSDHERSRDFLDVPTQIPEAPKKLLEAAQPGNVRVDDLVRVLPGHPAHVILQEARETQADVIVLGMHKHKGLVDFGSTARQVLAGAPRSVWLQKQPFTPIQRVLVPIDLSPDSLNALATACAMAKVFKARVRAIHCFQSSRFMAGVWPDYPDFGTAYALDDIRRATLADFEHIMEAFDWMGVEHEYDFMDGDPIQKVLELASTADLVVMGTHGRTGLSSAVLGNVAYSVMKHTEKPVLAIRHPERKLIS
jgi:nucleotide-binding universal stress UspA family protein